MYVRCSLDTEHWEFTLNTNLGGAFHATQAAARQMAAQGHGGSIIGISSISALVGGGRQAHYTPTKAGVLSLMQSCACALGRYNIRCNALLPGTIRTQLNDADLADPEKKAYMEGRIPLGRTGEPADLAGPAVFLASDLSKYVVSIVPLFLWMWSVSDVNWIEWRTIAGGRWSFCQSPIDNVEFKSNITRFMNERKIIKGLLREESHSFMPLADSTDTPPRLFRTKRGPFARPSDRIHPGSSPRRPSNSSKTTAPPVHARCRPASHCQT